MLESASVITRLEREERLNTLTHGLGACAASIAAVLLIAEASRRGGGAQIVGAVAFGVSMLLLYVASTLYHDTQNALLKARFKVFDHCAIFLLIAGTYTPFTLVALKDSGGVWLLPTIWALAAAGIVFKLFFTGRFKLVSTLIYLAMGWLVVTVIGPMWRAITPSCAFWLAAGGFAYTLGAGFYMAKKIPYTHAIWHGFVLLGTGCHYVAVTTQVWQILPV
jgi:hemolysin III